MNFDKTIEQLDSVIGGIRYGLDKSDYSGEEVEYKVREIVEYEQAIVVLRGNSD